MIFKFRLIGTGKEPFYRDIEIRENHTFFDLHNAIQDELGYDKKQMASFFLANNKWEKGLEINLFDMAEDSHTPVIIMDKTRLCDLIKEEKQRLLYLFDFFSDRAFFIELLSIITEDKNKNYPFCSSGKGRPPEQIIIEDPDLTDI
ncbi:MAG: hypothetical protein R6U58_13920 [Bacteroidales bacterium]